VSDTSTYLARWTEILIEVRTDMEATAVTSAVRNANDTADADGFDRGTETWFKYAIETYDFVLTEARNEASRNLDCPHGTYYCTTLGDGYRSIHEDCAFVAARDAAAGTR
jgi:hypothetical protein